jgi:hypothetical protein
MKPIKIHKLIVSKEVLRTLLSSELEHVRGGYLTRTEVVGGCSTFFDNKCSFTPETIGFGCPE